MPGLLVVIGCAPGWREELTSLDPYPKDIFAINRAGLEYLGEIKHWGSHHYRCFYPWMTWRRDLGGNMGFTTHSVAQAPLVDVVHPQIVVRGERGSSAILGVQTAVRQKYRGVVFCGVHLDGEYAKFRPSWTIVRKRYGHMVRAMGGWMAEVFGTPDREWLENAAAC